MIKHDPINDEIRRIECKRVGDPDVEFLTKLVRKLAGRLIDIETRNGRSAIEECWTKAN